MIGQQGGVDFIDKARSVEILASRLAFTADVRLCRRLPSGSVHPTTTNSSRLRHFDLTQIPRSPGAYGRSARLEITPSKPSLQRAHGNEGRHQSYARCTAAPGSPP